MTEARRPLKRTFFAVLTLLFFMGPVAQEVSAQPGTRILMVHDGGSLLPSSSADPVFMMRVLLSHFAEEVVVQGRETYDPAIAGAFDAVVFLVLERGVSEIRLPTATVPVIWVGQGSPAVQEGSIVFEQGELFEYDHARRGDKVLFTGTGQETPVLKVGEGDEVLAWATNMAESTPLAVKAKGRDLWFFTGIPFWEGNLFVFVDMLMDAMRQSAQSRGIFVRLDGIDPFADPTVLAEAAEWLAENGIAFGVSFQPAIWEAGTGNLVTLEENRELSAELRLLQDRGVPLFMRGFAGNIHRIPDDNAAEFWDIDKDIPLKEGREILRTRIAKGLDVCQRLGIHPEGFVAPGYRLPPDLLDTVADRFDLISGRIQASSWTGSASFVPPFECRAGAMRLIPENLGYVSGYMPQQSMADILSKAREMTIIRGALASLAYDPRLGVESLETLIEGLELEGYEPDSFVFAGNKTESEITVSDNERIPADVSPRYLSRYLAYGLLCIGGILASVLFATYIRRSTRGRRDLFR